MDIHSPLLPIAETALDALSLNQKMLAQNIANVNNHNYTSSRIDFTAYMDAVINAGVEDITLDSNNVYLKQNGSKVSVDLELAAMSENLQRFKAIVDVMNRRSGIMQLAMKGGGAA